MNKKSLIILVVILILATIFGVVYFKIKKPKPILNLLNTATVGNIITIENFSFNPSALTIKAGEEAVWEHNDSAAHSILGDFFQSKVMNRGDKFSFIFPAAGEYDYRCGIHSSMKGKIIVQ